MYLGKMTATVVLAGRYKINGLHTVEIKKSVHTLAQTAKLQLPLSVVYQNADAQQRMKITDLIKEGDSVSVAFGYDGKNNTEFSGYIKRINPKQPLELECEDEMYLFRHVNLKQSWKKAPITDVLKYVLNAVNAAYKTNIVLYGNVPEITVTNFVISDGANGIAVLQELADKYFTHCYITTINGQKTLYAGLLYGLTRGTVKHVLNRNTISIDDLKYQAQGDVQLNVTIINHLPDGTVKKVEFGDKHGKKIEGVNANGYKTQAELKHIADTQLAKYATSSYRGSFVTFLKPYCEPGYISQISDLQFPDRGGNYYIGTVTTNFGVGGGKRKIEIDIPA